MSPSPGAMDASIFCYTAGEPQVPTIHVHPDSVVAKTRHRATACLLPILTESVHRNAGPDLIVTSHLARQGCTVSEFLGSIFTRLEHLTITEGARRTDRSSIHAVSAHTKLAVLGAVPDSHVPGIAQELEISPARCSIILLVAGAVPTDWDLVPRRQGRHGTLLRGQAAIQTIQPAIDDIACHLDISITESIGDITAVWRLPPLAVTTTYLVTVPSRSFDTIENMRPNRSLACSKSTVIPRIDTVLQVRIGKHAAGITDQTAPHRVQPRHGFSLRTAGFMLFTTGLTPDKGQDKGRNKP